MVAIFLCNCGMGCRCEMGDVLGVILILRMAGGGGNSGGIGFRLCVDG